MADAPGICPYLRTSNSSHLTLANGKKPPAVDSPCVGPACYLWIRDPAGAGNCAHVITPIVQIALANQLATLIDALARAGAITLPAPGGEHAGAREADA